MLRFLRDDTHKHVHVLKYPNDIVKLKTHNNTITVLSWQSTCFCYLGLKQLSKYSRTQIMELAIICTLS
jgi:hypothetical protein